MGPGTGPEPVVSMEGIVKVYRDGTVALRGVDFSVLPGEIHGLLGENGAGKTTLMRILYGELRPTSGRVLVGGREASPRGPWEALESGIGMVHQHFTLIPVFTVMENLSMVIPGGSLSRIGDPAVREKAEEIMGELGLPVPLDARVEDLPVGIRQRVEILKALMRDVRVLILDEPTSVLTPLEVRELFSLLGRLRERGVTVIFISHKLREVMGITDRVTVLRRGRVVGTVRTGDVTESDLARMMVGREVEMEIERRPPSPGGVLLSVEGLWVRGEEGGWAVRGVDLEVRSGEVLGVAGVAGNGQRELVEAITGLRRADRGRVLIAGREMTNSPPRELYRAGLAHVPEDRQGVGLIMDFSVAENSVLGIHDGPPFSGRWVMRWDTVRERAAEIVRRFSVVVPGLDAPARHLSGGNQQKLIVGREIMKGGKVIVADQPTHGLDVAATEYIRRLLLEERDRGAAVLLVSTDLDEILQISDRVVVMYEGRIVGGGRPEELTEERLGLLMGGAAG